MSDTDLEFDGYQIRPKGWKEMKLTELPPAPKGPNPNGYPAPTIDPPDPDELSEMCLDSIAEATDGCTVEPDGTCEHGYPSWPLYYGLI